MVTILYSFFDCAQEEFYYWPIINSFPKKIKKKILKFKYAKDRIAALLGKRLLLEGLRITKFNEFNLSCLQYSEFDRPYFFNGPDFNITHSDFCVACIIGDNIRVGIDVERIVPINHQDFAGQLSPAELHSINSSNLPNHEFFNFWTRKEAIIKANGKGLNIPLKEVTVTSDQVCVENEIWYLRKLALNKNYASHFAINRLLADSDIHIYQMSGSSFCTQRDPDNIEIV